MWSGSANPVLCLADGSRIDSSFEYFMEVAPVQIKTPARDSAVSLCAGYTLLPLKNKVSWKPGSSKDVYRSKSVAPAWVCIYLYPGSSLAQGED